MTDWQLLRRYIDRGSEDAFSQLVERHRKLVYWTCSRETRNDQLAEDAAQAVFLVLARRASTIRRDASLAGWLFSVARNVSRRALETERRQRRIEERMAVEMDATTRSTAQGDHGLDPESLWSHIESRLNEAMSALPEVDRSAILLRHCDQFSYAEVAGAIGMTEEAARKRITRGLERLRGCLAKKDVQVSASVLTAVLAEHLVRPVPAACATLTGKSILAMSAPSGLASIGHGSLLTKGATIIMTETLKKTLIASIILLAGAGITIYTHVRPATTSPGKSASVSQFQDLASPANAADPLNARKTIDQDYIKMATGMMQEGDIALDFLPSGQKPMNMSWGRQPHAVGIALRRFTAAGLTATAVVDTKLTTNGNLGRLEVNYTAVHEWAKTSGRWVLTKVTVTGKPVILLNGAPPPPGTPINVTT